MKRLWILSCTMLLLLAGLASAQVTFDFTGGGARAEGMGKAFYGVSDDATAVGWNPAGLIAQQRSVLSLSYASFRPRGSFKYELERFGQFGSFQNVTNVSFLSPVRIRAHQFVLSAAYTQTIEDYSYAHIGFNVDSLPNPWDPTSTYDLRWEGYTTQHYNPYMLNFGFGTPLSKNLAMGIAANVYTGRAVISLQDNIYRYRYEPIDKLLQPLTSITGVRQLDTAKYSGINFTFGFQYTFPRLTAGLVVKSGFSLNYLADKKFADTVWYNGRSAGGTTVFSDDRLTKYDIPWTIGAGGAYKLQENWIWAADAEYRPYSGHELRIRDSIKVGSSGGDQETFRNVDPLWYSVFTLRTGTEYMMKSSSRFFPVVPLRFGFSFVPVPTPDLVVDSNWSTGTLHVDTTRSSTTAYNLTAGTGVHWSQIHLDLSYVFSIHDQVATRSIAMNPTNPAATLDWRGKEKTRSHRVNLTFTGYF